jgi:ABC-type nitrate/sulfonate/bicarbonate transport system ATPase subunit
MSRPAPAVGDTTQTQPDSVADAPGDGAKIEVHGVSKRFGDGREAVAALADASLAVGSSEFVTIIGPSGCGKSTLFNVIAGLTAPSSGTVSMDGRRIDGEPGHVGYMMQRDCLMQWRTILDNVVLGLECIGVGRAEARQRARAHMAKFGLAGFERRYPSALSGGMRQRAALLRTLLLDREVMLLDEPFGALDAITRNEMQEWLLSIWGEYRRTIIFITHDVEEAIYLSDRVYVMRGPPGRISAEVRIDLPRPRVYEDVVGLPEFAHTKQHLLRLVKEDPATS